MSISKNSIAPKLKGLIQSLLFHHIITSVLRLLRDLFDNCFKIYYNSLLFKIMYYFDTNITVL